MMMSFVQSTERIIVDHLQIDLVTYQLSNVVQAILDHCWPVGKVRVCD